MGRASQRRAKQNQFDEELEQAFERDEHFIALTVDVVHDHTKKLDKPKSRARRSYSERITPPLLLLVLTLPALVYIILSMRIDEVSERVPQDIVTGQENQLTSEPLESFE